MDTLDLILPLHLIGWWGVSLYLYISQVDKKKKSVDKGLLFEVGSLGMIWPLFALFGLLFVFVTWPIYLYKFFKDGWAKRIFIKIFMQKKSV